MLGGQHSVAVSSEMLLLSDVGLHCAFLAVEVCQTSCGAAARARLVDIQVLAFSENYVQLVLLCLDREPLLPSLYTGFPAQVNCRVFFPPRRFSLHQLEDSLYRH
jgi:hypothetical protein